MQSYTFLFPVSGNSYQKGSPETDAPVHFPANSAEFRANTLLPRETLSHSWVNCRGVMPYSFLKAR